MASALDVQLVHAAVEEDVAQRVMVGCFGGDLIKTDESRSLDDEELIVSALIHSAWHLQASSRCQKHSFPLIAASKHFRAHPIMQSHHFNGV